MYNADSLKAGIDACKNNIKTFEDAIEKEHMTIKDYRDKIEILERKAREAKMKEDFSKYNIKVERSKDDNQN